MLLQEDLIRKTDRIDFLILNSNEIRSETFRNAQRLSESEIQTTIDLERHTCQPQRLKQKSLRLTTSCALKAVC